MMVYMKKKNNRDLIKEISAKFEIGASARVFAHVPHDVVDAALSFERVHAVDVVEDDGRE